MRPTVLWTAPTRRIAKFVDLTRSPAVFGSGLSSDCSRHWFGALPSPEPEIAPVGPGRPASEVLRAVSVLVRTRSAKPLPIPRSRRNGDTLRTRLERPQQLRTPDLLPRAANPPVPPITTRLTRSSAAQYSQRTSAGTYWSTLPALGLTLLGGW